MLTSSDSHRRRKKEKDPDRERTSPRSKDKDKDKERDRDHRDRDRDRDRHKSNKSRKPRSSASRDDDDDNDNNNNNNHAEHDRLHQRSSRERISRTSSSSQTKSHHMAVVPEMTRRSDLGSANNSRTSLPYPSVDKTYSKESIYARDDVDRRKAAMTPDLTDIDGSHDDKKGEASPSVPPTPTRAPPPPPRAPPSPPLTATTAADLRKTASANSSRRTSEAVHREMEAGRRSVDSGTRVTTPAGQRHTASRSSVREQDSMTDLTSTTGSQPSTVRAKSPRAKSPHAVPTRTKTASPAGTRTHRTSKTYKTKTKPRGSSELTLDSESTSVPLYHARRTRSPAYSDASPASAADSSPRTPTQHSILPATTYDGKERP
ncbi:hypothetical protein N0V94_002765, partial [Neodidymelliopsis sp. IMI 364377]